MTIVLSISVVVLAALLFLLLGSQIEMYRSIEHLREYSGLIDRPTPVALDPAGQPPSSVGLPAELDSALVALVLLLSDKCATCRSIAASLDGARPRDLLIVIEADESYSDPELTLAYDLDPHRVVIDPTREIGEALGISMTPVAVVVENGRLARATSVPSSRQFQALLDSVRKPQALMNQPLT